MCELLHYIKRSGGDLSKLGVISEELSGIYYLSNSITSSKYRYEFYIN